MANFHFADLRKTVILAACSVLSVGRCDAAVRTMAAAVARLQSATFVTIAHDKERVMAASHALRRFFWARSIELVMIRMLRVGW